MHHFKAKGGTHFHFNSDLSGEVSAHGGEDPDGRAWIPAADLLEFVDWYRKTPGYGAPEPDDDGPYQGPCPTCHRGYPDPT